MGLFDGVRNNISSAARAVQQKAVSLAKEPIKAGQTIKKAYDTVKEVRTNVKDAFEQVASVKKDGFKATWKNNWSKAISEATDPKSKLNLGGIAKQVGGAYSTVTNAVKLPGQIATAVQDVRDAVRSGTAQARDKAIGTVASAASTAVSTVKGGLELARDANKFGSAYRAASSAFRSVAPNATGKAVFAAASTAARQTFEGATKLGDVRRAVGTAVSNVARHGDTVAHTVGAASRAAGRTMIREGSEAAGRAAIGAAARASAGPLARAAGRFAPGANVAIAALDVASAYSTVRDPNASTTSKVTSVITAVGSVAAATNIPVVSQVGAAVSTVSSFIGGLFG
jgi:hypothetical protein